MISVKRTPLDGDIEGIVARAKVVGNAAYVAFPGSRLAAAVLGGVFFTSSDVTTRDPGGSAIPGPVITAMGASPDGSGTLVQLDVDLRGLLEAICLPLTELEIPFKSIGGTTAYARGSDPRIASQPDDNLQYGLVLDLRVGAEGGDRDATALREYPILEALSILGSAVCAFQEPSDVPKSPEFQLAAHFFCSPDNTSKSGTDADTWTLDTAATPYLHALVGRQTNKVGWLIAAAIGFLSAPTLLGAFAVAAVVGPASGTISLSEGSKGDLAASHPVAGLRGDDSKARVIGFMRALEDLLADFLGDHSPDVVSTKAISGRMMGSVSALARGAAVRSALWQRSAVQWDFRGQARQQTQPPPPRPGPPPAQPPPGPGPSPRTQDQTLNIASVVPTVPDSLLRLFVTNFSNISHAPSEEGSPPVPLDTLPRDVTRGPFARRGGGLLGRRSEQVGPTVRHARDPGPLGRNGWAREIQRGRGSLEGTHHTLPRGIRGRQDPIRCCHAQTPQVRGRLFRQGPGRRGEGRRVVGRRLHGAVPTRESGPGLWRSQGDNTSVQDRTQKTVPHQRDHYGPPHAMRRGGPRPRHVLVPLAEDRRSDRLGTVWGYRGGVQTGWPLALGRVADIREALPRHASCIFRSPMPRRECGRRVHAQISGRDELQRHQVTTMATTAVSAPRRGRAFSGSPRNSRTIPAAPSTTRASLRTSSIS